MSENNQGISVTSSGVKVVSKETFKTLFIAGFAYGAAQLVNSEVAMAAIIPAGGVLGMLAYGIIERVHHWKVMQYLADKVDDAIAFVERK